MGCRDWIVHWFRQCFRTKPLSSLTSETQLKRCLGIVDLVFLGIGAMVDSGIYVMTGIAARTEAGQSISAICILDILLLIVFCVGTYSCRCMYGRLFIGLITSLALSLLSHFSTLVRVLAAMPVIT